MLFVTGKMRWQHAISLCSRRPNRGKERDLSARGVSLVELNQRDPTGARTSSFFVMLQIGIVAWQRFNQGTET